ncbi:MAG: DUF4351 domain-containing protein [Microcoleus sp.]
MRTAHLTNHQQHELPIALLENLADALLNFNDISDLTAWLQTNDFYSNYSNPK